MTRRVSVGSDPSGVPPLGSEAGWLVQVSSPQHQVNPAASSYYVRRKVREPSSSCRAKAIDRVKILNATRGPSGVQGNGTFTQRTTELGRSSSTRKAGPISLRMKGACVERKSEEPIVLQGKDNRTLSSRIREGVSA